MAVDIVAREDGIWAINVDGTNRILIDKNADVRQLATSPGKEPGQLRIFAVTGTVVAEYLLSGLNEFAQKNAGEIELP